MVSVMISRSYIFSVWGNTKGPLLEIFTCCSETLIPGRRAARSRASTYSVKPQLAFRK